MNPIELFEQQCRDRIETYPGSRMEHVANEFLRESTEPKYSYNFSWLGRPIIQYPQDMVAMQQLIWSLKPDLIVETGIAHGGSLIFSASMLELNALCGGPAEAKVVGIDIDIRSHNREAILAHPMAKRIKMIEGSSVSPDMIRQVQAEAESKSSVLVCLDSNHTHDHVLEELKAYADIVTVGSYCVVFDTIIEDLDADMYPDRPWGPANSPRSAVSEFLKQNRDFVVDATMDHRLLISVAKGGYLQRVR